MDDPVPNPAPVGDEIERLTQERMRLGRELEQARRELHTQQTQTTKVVQALHREASEWRERAEKAEAELAWQPIATVPKDKLPIRDLLLCHAEKRWVRMGKWYDQQGEWYYSGTSERSQWAQVKGDEPTHWRPLPKPPALAPTPVSARHSDDCPYLAEQYSAECTCGGVQREQEQR